MLIFPPSMHQYLQTRYVSSTIEDYFYSYFGLIRFKFLSLSLIKFCCFFSGTTGKDHSQSRSFCIVDGHGDLHNFIFVILPNSEGDRA